ncbi:hypothetical protein Tco_1270730, partial [Tanacetum coccineum]
MPPPPENFSGGHFRPRPKSLPITGSIQPPYPLALTRAAATRTTTTAATTVTPPPSQPRTTKGAVVCYKYPRGVRLVEGFAAGVFVRGGSPHRRVRLGWQPPPKPGAFGCRPQPKEGVSGW